MSPEDGVESFDGRTSCGVCDGSGCPQCCDPEEFEDESDAEFSVDFADPGGRSALRAERPDNPRDLPCPTCGEPDRLTPEDVSLGYQCDDCADAAEGFGP